MSNTRPAEFYDVANSRFDILKSSTVIIIIFIAQYTQEILKN
jgi:hypothetical protein